MSVDTKHPEYTTTRSAEWRLCADAFNGESAIKAGGETYLPKPSGYATHTDGGVAAYAAYKMRAQFPDVMAASIGAMIGIIHAEDTEVEMPSGLDFLRESVDGSNTTLEDFHKRITRHLLTAGRCGVLADAPVGGGNPYLAAYAAPTIINWDESFAVLDESGTVRSGFDWDEETKYRVLQMVDGRYEQTVYVGDDGTEVEDVSPSKQGGGALDYFPFVIAGSRELSNSIETPPLIGVARAALAMYQLSADRRLQLYMSGQETLVAINGDAPKAVGAGVVHEMHGTESMTPDLKYVSPTCSGIAAHKEAIDDAKGQAIQSGARLFEQSGQAQESGEARAMRFRSETANLQTIAQSSCAALERGLRGCAVMLGLNPDEVVVTPPKDLLDATITPEQAAALWQIVKERGLSYETFYEKVQRGGIASQERTADDEFALIDGRELAGVEDL